MDGIWGPIINGVFAIAVLVLGARLNKKVNSVTNAVEETHHQVKNSHKSNLRDDIDGIKTELKEMRNETTSKFNLTNQLIRGVQRTQALRGDDIVEIRNSLSEHLEEAQRREDNLRAEIRRHTKGK